jgi:hypothetical protein
MGNGNLRLATMSAMLCMAGGKGTSLSFKGLVELFVCLVVKHQLAAIAAAGYGQVVKGNGHGSNVDKPLEFVAYRCPPYFLPSAFGAVPGEGASLLVCPTGRVQSVRHREYSLSIRSDRHPGQ